MTALEAVSTYLPPSVPLVELAGRLALEPMQVKLFHRFHGLVDIAVAPRERLVDLLRHAVRGLDGLVGNEPAVRYVLHARAFPVVAPYPDNPLHDLCQELGLGHALAFTVTHQSCASGLLALDAADRLLAADPDPDALALVLAGEKAFTREAQVLPQTSVFGEGAAACLVSRDGRRDRMLSYACRLRGEFDDPRPESEAAFQREYHAGLAEVIVAALDQAGVDLADLRLILPHNVNTVSWHRLCRRLDLPRERVLLDNVPRYGHVFCVDAFLNHQTACRRGLLRPGDRYLVAAAGAGRGATFSAMVFAH